MKKLRIVYLSIFILSTSGLFTALDGSITLIENHQPKAVIVIPADPVPAEQYAAHELRSHLYKITGCFLPITTDNAFLTGEWQFRNGFLQVHAPDKEGYIPTGPIISIGNTVYAQRNSITVDTDSPFPDPYRIVIRNNQLSIMGKGDRGHLFGVYGFLEDYIGCRWFLPGPLGEVLPAMDTITLEDTDDLQIPSFPIRMQSGVYGYRPYVEWYIRNRMHLRERDETFYEDYDLAIRGIVTHAMYEILPPDRYKYDHPEYYSLYKPSSEWRNTKYPGYRDARDLTAAEPGALAQLCTTNPEVIAHTVTYVRDYTRNHPDVHYVSLCPNDVPWFCLCDRCLALDPAEKFYRKDWPADRQGLELTSDRVWTYCNAVASQFPDQQFYVLAYHNYVSPPQYVQPQPNVMSGICHMNPACYAHAMNDPACEQNAKFDAIIRGWTAVHDNFMLYAYTAKTMWEQMPWPLARQYAVNIQYLYEQGIRNFYSQSHSPGRWGQLGTHFYTNAKLIWDVNRDIEDILEDYFEKMYGPSGPHMAAYYSMLEDALDTPGIFVHHSAWVEARQFLTPAVMGRGDGLLDEAFANAPSGAVRDRIRIIWTAHEYAKLYLRATDLGKIYDRTKDMETLRRCVETYESLIHLMRKNGRLDGVIYFGGELDVYTGIETNPRRHYLYRKNQLEQFMK